MVPGGMVGSEYLEQLVNWYISEAVEDFKRLDQIPPHSPAFQGE